MSGRTRAVLVFLLGLGCGVGASEALRRTGREEPAAPQPAPVAQAPAAQDEGNSGWDTGDPPAKVVDPPPELFAELRHPDTCPLRRATLLGTLGQYRESPAAVRELISFLLFDLSYYRNARGSFAGTAADQALLDPKFPDDYPAAVSLLEIGPFAAPFLVDDYVSTFATCVKVSPDDSPDLFRVAWLLSLDPRMAQKAVTYALQRSAVQSHDDIVQRACAHLIKKVVGQFPESERAKLFPPEALRK